MKGKFNLDETLGRVLKDNLFISEITLAELKFGAGKSEHIEKNPGAVEKFLTGVQLLPMSLAVDFFAREKARLRKAGTIIDDFDLLIGATAVAYELTLVTNNMAHLGRVRNVHIEDWTLPAFWPGQ